MEVSNLMGEKNSYLNLLYNPPTGLGSYGKRLASVATVMPFPQIEKNGYDCLADMLFEPPSPENPFELQSLTPSVEYSR